MKSQAKVSVIESTVGPQHSRGVSFLIAATLFLITAAVFSPARKNDFVAVDDHRYVYEEPRVLNGISPDGLMWAMTASVSANWHPLTLMSLQLDAQLFGSGPAGFHITSLLIHAANAALAFLAIFSVTGCRWKSAIVAALFALHPTRVESVAWISERKDVLSGCFFFLTIIAYAHFVRAPSVWRYALVAILLALGICAKPMLVTTPCVLLLLDYWPLRRLPELTAKQLSRFGKLFLEKLPLFGLSFCSSMMTLLYQENALQHLTQQSVSSRLETAVRGLTTYLAQTGWPVRLSNFYPFRLPSTGKFLAASGVLLAVTGVAVWQRNRRPYLLVGWLWFVGMLIPVCGLVQVGLQQRADRYLYLPQIGLFLAVVWGVAEIVHRWPAARIASVGLLSVCLVGCGYLTVQQIAVWRDTQTLWRHAYQCDPQNPLAILYFMKIAFDEGDHAEGVRLADEFFRIEDKRNLYLLPRVSELLFENGEYEASIRAIDRALACGPRSEWPATDLYSFRGASYAAWGRWEDAVNDYRQMVKLSPNNVPQWFCLAHALNKIGQHEESAQLCAAALQVFPQFPAKALASAWKISTSHDATARDRFQAVCLAEQVNAMTNGTQFQCLDVLAAAYAATGQFEKSVATAERAIQCAESQGHIPQANAMRARLKRYEDRRKNSGK